MRLTPHKQGSLDAWTGKMFYRKYKGRNRKAYRSGFINVVLKKFIRKHAASLSH